MNFQDLLIEIEKIIDKKINKTRPLVLFSDVELLYFKHHKDKMSEGFLDKKRYIFERVHNYFKDYNVEDINTLVVQEWINNVVSKYPNRNQPYKFVKVGTQKNYLKHLNAILNYAVSIDKLSVNRVSRIEFDFETPFEAQLLTSKQEAKILAYYRDYDFLYYLYLLFASNLGARRGELLGIYLPNINLKEKSVKLDRTVYETNNQIRIKERLKTKKSHRVIRLSDFCFSELLYYLKNLKHNDSDYLFFDNRTNNIIKPTTIYQNFKRVVYRTFKINMRLHDLRHSFNQFQFENHSDRTTTMDIMGHTTLAINDIYRKPSLKHQKKQVNNLGDELEKYISFYSEKKPAKNICKVGVKNSYKKQKSPLK